MWFFGCGRLMVLLCFSIFCYCVRIINFISRCFFLVQVRDDAWSYTFLRQEPQAHVLSHHQHGTILPAHLLARGLHLHSRLVPVCVSVVRARTRYSGRFIVCVNIVVCMSHFLTLSSFLCLFPITRLVACRRERAHGFRTTRCRGYQEL